MKENYFSSRRSCRQYKSDPIDIKEIENIVTLASKAPTCGNMQLYSVIITEDEENKKKLASFHFNQPAATTAPVILTICADFNRFTRWCEISNAKSGFNNFHSFITAMTDAVIFAQQIVTIAEQKGYGTCYLGTVTYNANEISKFLQLPSSVVPVASISLGIPNEEGEYTDRLPIQGILHKEFYRKDSDEDIKKYFRIHDENANNLKFIKENDKNNLAQVFSEIRYPKEMNEKVSDSFLEILKIKNYLK